jgi:hypothetical protein
MAIMTYTPGNPSPSSPAISASVFPSRANGICHLHTQDRRQRDYTFAAPVQTLKICAAGGLGEGPPAGADSISPDRTVGE